MAVTLAIYYGTPWIRWDRGPHAPDQAVLVDLANRRFYMFQIEIWPHEFYYVAGLLIMAGIGLFLVTSAVGRAWCGYACPQTVWRSEEHTSELQSLMRISYAVFCLKKQKSTIQQPTHHSPPLLINNHNIPNNTT